MKNKSELKHVKDLLELKANDLLKANPEYQRGLVWSKDQKRKLIDSILRGYPIPLIYLHVVKKEVGGISNTMLYVIDGQQRINAIHEYSEGAFNLYDPIGDERQARFPYFIKNEPCPWAGKYFHELSEDLQNQFKDQQLPVVTITSDGDHEPRDLFIRLQAGTPLSNQDKRDAWPGNFNEFILKIAGKPEVPKYPGHDFFHRCMGVKQGANRSKFRQFCAQWALLYFSRRSGTPLGAIDTNAEGLDNFYYQNIDFDLQSVDAKRFESILSKLADLLGDGKRRALKSSEAMHLILIVDSLLDEYTRGWEADFAAAFDGFMASYISAKSDRYSSNAGPYWVIYGQGTRTNADRGDTIMRRHEFFVQEMRKRMPNLKAKDENRLFGAIEREIIYYREGKKCQVCAAEVKWDEMEIHHVTPHFEGGKTSLENGALVHGHCHPKGEAATKFKLDLERRKSTSSGESTA
ncbi:MAG: DUF262 domain-containing protein [Armatimonadota bacterium]